MLHAALHSKPFSNLKIRYIYYYYCCKSIYIPDLCCLLYLALGLLNRYNGYVFTMSTPLYCLEDKCCSRLKLLQVFRNKKRIKHWGLNLYGAFLWPLVRWKFQSSEICYTSSIT